MNRNRTQIWLKVATAALIALLCLQSAASAQTTGTVVAWGYNEYGQCDVPPALNGVGAVGGGSAHSVAMKEDGTVVAWGAGGPGQSGWPHYGQSIVPPGLTGVVAIAAGSWHTWTANPGQPAGSIG